MTEERTETIELYPDCDKNNQPPADFIEECRLYWERIHTAKEKATPTYYAIDLDGTMYFYHGNTRIKVIEHFNDNGKPIEALVEDVVQYAAAN